MKNGGAESAAVFGRSFGFAREDGRRHRADAAGHGRDGLHDRLHLGEAGIAAEIAVRTDVDAHVQHDLARADALRADHAGLTGGDDEDIRLAADGGQIFAAAVADGHGRVLGEQQQGDRLADDEAAADHDHALALDGHVIMLEQRHAGRGGAGRIAAVGAGVDRGERAVGDAVHILSRVEGAAGGLVVEVLGQRAEHQNAVNTLVLVERTDVVHQLLLARVLGQHDLTDRDADLLAALERAALIGQIVLARTHAQNGKAGLRAVFLQLLRLLTQLFGQRPGGVGPLE